MFQNLSPGAIGIRCAWIEGLDLAREAGYQGADLNLGEAQRIAQERGTDTVRALFASRGLQIGGWGLPVDWRSPAPQFYEQLGRLPALCQLAADLGCHRTLTIYPPASDNLTRQELFNLAVKRLRLVAEVLRDYGHRIGIEFIGPRTSRMNHKHGAIYSMDGLLALACAIGTGNVGLLFDVWHWYTCRSTLDDVRHLAAADVVYVHINDAPAGIDALDQMDLVRCLPGETGIIPNVELLRTLKAIGFDGPVTIEPFSQSLSELAAQDPLAAAKRARASLEPIWREAGLA
ncbi:MAG: sugar phosphate isomerase/epimerase [Armatimonadetes bacterium]|nr:sugar phosphate isomerase/epimerase [Armatimonadota bacterium]